MILLKTLQLNNFLSHEKTEINFGENEKTLIDGQSGAGKSSIFEAIIWGLYGQGRADNKSLVRKGSKKGSVLIVLEKREGDNKGGSLVYITRSVSPSGKHSLEVSIQDPSGIRVALPLSGVREIQAWIDKDLIGASYTLFVNSVAYVQGNAESFVSQTAPKRKDLLLEIVKAEDYSKYYEQARGVLNTIENDRSRLAGQVTELDSRLASLNSSKGDSGVNIAIIMRLSGELHGLEPQIKELEDKQAIFTSISKTIDVLKEVLYRAEIDKKNAEESLAIRKSKIGKKDQYLGLLSERPQLEKFIKDEEVIKESLTADFVVSVEDEKKQKEYRMREPKTIDRSAEILRDEEQLKFLSAKEICPSGEKCPYHSKTIESIDFYTKEIAKLKQFNQKENRELMDWAMEGTKLPNPTSSHDILIKIREKESKIAGLNSDLNKMSLVQKDLDVIMDIEKEIPSIETEIKDKTLRVEKAIKDKEEAEKSADPNESYKTEFMLSELKDKQKTFNADITRATSTLERIDQDNKEIAEIEKKIESIKGEELNALNEKSRKVALVKDAFGSKGIETLVIDYLLPKLEDRINEVLSKLSDFRVRLDTQKKSADGESMVEGLFITILNEVNEEMPFEAYSGGEKLKISVSISEALATLQKVGFRLFDEVFIGLDENSTESFADVLNGLQHNFGQVLCISHLVQIKELFDKKISIIKNNNISYVK